ncbi:hypothetical protein [Desulforamulus hydrothermalis]|uniref:hypothetical protein n=1 Tax=Desulforamulus hydrothermalis TaxID=412895 RepID=UPI001390A3A6|nr:hypothetical protein [Desulforamulus hydrothermalis]
MIPFGSGLRTDSTVIRSGRPWGRLKRAILARFGWRPHPVGAPPWLLTLIKCCDRCFDKSPTGDHKTTSLSYDICLQSVGAHALWVPFLLD